MSAYAEPDTAELNYHAGTACHSLAQCVMAIHIGVQCFNHHEADVVSVIFLLFLCIDPNVDISKIRIDHNTATGYLLK